MRLHSRQPPSELRLGLAPLGLGLRVDQVRNSLGLGQIEFAMLEGPPRELSGLGQPQAQARKALEESVDHGGTAVNLEFSHILARVTSRRREPEDQAAVDQLACRVPQLPHHGAARGGDLTGQGLHGLGGSRS